MTRWQGFCSVLWWTRWHLPRLGLAFADPVEWERQKRAALRKRVQRAMEREETLR